MPGFTRKHNCKLLVWFEAHDDIQDARLRELQMKKYYLTALAMMLVASTAFAQRGGFGFGFGGGSSVTQLLRMEEVQKELNLTSEQKVQRREELFEAARSRFRGEVQPTLESLTFGSFLTTPINNATLLARMVYYHRLYDFQAHLERHGGDVEAAVAALAASAEDAADAFSLLPRTERVAAGR